MRGLSRKSSCMETSRLAPVAILARTGNAKLTRKGRPTVYATTLPVIGTCPQSCPLLDHGCYGQRGPGGHVARLERNADRSTPTARLYLDADALRRRQTGSAFAAYGSGEDRVGAVLVQPGPEPRGARS